MAQPESGKKVMGWAAAATLLAAAPFLAACQGGSHSSSASHDNNSPSPSTSASGNSGTSSDGGSSTQADDHSTPSSVVGAWVTAVIEKDAERVCLLSAEPGNGSSPAKATTPQTCNASTTQQMAVGLPSMSKAFTPQNATGKPTVKVNGPTPKGDKAVVPASKIIVDGKPLRAIMLSRSHGVDPKSFKPKMKAVKINEKWYMSDFDDNSGTQTLHPQTPS
ncbi:MULTISPECIES: hypothetical protein [unclassified Streptomyces]|uniref:hypothetical protein n=1 Tax=unclassified Streptomyces TaxID=2593676 RepID=UPI002E14B5EE|nr:hypothetical protein OG452_19725 [Streptomyces sp. NBC_01197]WSS49928.1 hypothetical protein OG708_15530 [Streptomyces sp. NBC_01180]